MSSKSVLYRIVCASDLERLEQQVEELLMDGWKPQGGVAVCTSELQTSLRGTTISFFQSLYRSYAP